MDVLGAVLSLISAAVFLMHFNVPGKEMVVYISVGTSVLAMIISVTGLINKSPKE